MAPMCNNISNSQSYPVIDTQEASLEFLLGRSVHREGGGGGGEKRENSKTLFYKDCSLGLVKNLSNN